MTEKKELTHIVKFSSIAAADKSSIGHAYDNPETYSILWLDPLVNDAKDYLDAQQRLRGCINYIRTFKTSEDCEQYIESVPSQDRIIFIVNHQLGSELVPRIHQLQQICSIYIYSTETKQDGQWIKEFHKIKSVCTQSDVLVAQIKSDRARRSHNKIDEPLVISILDASISYQLNDQFVRSHLLIDCLLRMKDNSSGMGKLITLCEENYKDNKTELAIIHEFEKNYCPTRALRWYTRQSFLSRMLNKAIRMQDIHVLFLFRFFIDDIEQQLIKNQCSEPIRLYRAQLLTTDEFQILRRATGGLLMVNTFLSTTVSREASLAFLDAMASSDGHDMQRVLFEIDADPRQNGVKPFANIIWTSYSFGQEEVLMMMGSIFRITEIHYNGNEMCVIRLVLCSETDQELKNDFQRLKKDYNAKSMDLFSFGRILFDMGSFDEAKKFYLRFLDDLPSNSQDLATCYHALGNVAADKGDCDLSLEWYEKLHDLLQRTLEPDDARLADSHVIIGNIYGKKNDYKHALQSYSQALLIYQRAFGDQHLIVAECSDKVASVFERDKKYFQALKYYEKALAIRQTSLSADHSDLGASHSKVAHTRLLLCHYYLALGHYNISLKIKQTALPLEHLSIAADYYGIAETYKAQGELRRALSYYERVAEIYRSQLPSGHSDIVEIERTIRFLSAQAK